MPRAASAVLALLAFVALSIGVASPARAQSCSPAWQIFDPTPEGNPGVNGTVKATKMWDPDGAGPQTPKLIVGGEFTMARNVPVSNIAAFDPVSGEWSSIGPGSGLNGPVEALAVLPSGELVVGGRFTRAGFTNVDRIVSWSGSNWSPLGSGISGSLPPPFGAPPVVYALTVMPNGDLVAGGLFTTAGGVSASNIARWNGFEWSALGSGTLRDVYALAVLQNGDLVAGGRFDGAGGFAASCIARWNGLAWSNMASEIQGTSPPAVHALAVLPDGSLVAGGSFTGIDGTMARNIAVWGGAPGLSYWRSMRGGTNGPVNALAALPGGGVVLAGPFTKVDINNTDLSARNIARWDGSAYSTFGASGPDSFNPFLYALAVLPNGHVVAGGIFTSAGGVSARNIASVNGSTWSALPSSDSMNAPVRCIARVSNGDLVAGGEFTSAGGVPANRIARWNGSSWQPMGSGMNGPVNAVAQLTNGFIIAGGSFTIAGGVPVSNIALWNGVDWVAMGSGVNGEVKALAVTPGGALVVGGSFTSAGGVGASSIARWNGGVWSALGSGVGGAVTPSVDALAVLPGGDVVAAGFFTTAGGGSARNIARWNGTVWSNLGSGLTGQFGLAFVYALAVLSNGDLLAGGDFDFAGGASANNIARWNGSAWSALGSGLNNNVRALTVRSNGYVVAGGDFTSAGGVSANRIAQWDGAAWSNMGSGMDIAVYALAAPPSGDLVAGGWFNSVSGVSAKNIARGVLPVLPSITSQPQNTSTPVNGLLFLAVDIGVGGEGVTARWQRNGVDVVSGPGGAGPGGGVVEITTAPLLDGTRKFYLQTRYPRPIDAGTYTAVLSNGCFSVTTSPAIATLTPAVCPADIDRNGVVDTNDLLFFLGRFGAIANIPNSFPWKCDFNYDLVVNTPDLIFFLGRFGSSCP
jgi:hypothetical protein